MRKSISWAVRGFFLSFSLGAAESRGSKEGGYFSLVVVVVAAVVGGGGGGADED